MKNVEVLLREHVDNLGRCGDVVRVRAGHARNYLLPKRLAVHATDENKRIMERRRARLDVEEAARNLEIDAKVERLGMMAYNTVEKADENGRLYGSVSSAAIAGFLRTTGFTEIGDDDVRIDTPIKTVGSHKVRVHLHAERFAEVAVEVKAEGDA